MQMFFETYLTHCTPFKWNFKFFLNIISVINYILTYITELTLTTKELREVVILTAIIWNMLQSHCPYKSNTFC